MLAWSSARPKAAVASWKAPVSLVQEQGVAQTLWRLDDRRWEIEIRLAVAVGVEDGRRCSVPGSGPADHGLISLEIAGRGPAVSGWKADVKRPGGLEPRGNRRRLRPCRRAGKLG